MKKISVVFGICCLLFSLVACITHTHAYNQWNYNTITHYQECSCGNKINEENHQFDSWIVESQEGQEIKYRTCSVCGYIEFDKILLISDEMNQYIDQLISETSGYIPAWNQESFKGRWNYIDGVFLNSVVSLYYKYEKNDTTKASHYKEFLIRYVNCYINESGEFVNPVDQSSGFKTDELDSICESKILFDLYEMTEDVRYLNAIYYTYDILVSQSRVTGSSNFYHKEIYTNQIWLDGMYMYAPFYARYAVSTNRTEIFDEIKNQYQYIRQHMYDEEKGLYYHGYDATKSIFWANPTTGCSSSFWLRSMGWYLVSLCDTIQYYPEGENKEYLKGLLVEGIEGIMKYQDSSSKMFYQLIDKGDITLYVPGSYIEGLRNTAYSSSGDYISNYLESSGSSMIAYTLMKGSRLGYLDSKYLNEGKSIYEGIYEHSFDGSKLKDICITAGLGPENRTCRDGSEYYYLAEPVGSNDAKGVGPFIMAYIEYMGDIGTIPTPEIDVNTYKSL